MADNLKIIIGGDARGLQEELKKSQVELNKTADAAKKTDTALSDIGSKATTGIKSVQTEMGKAAIATTDLGNKSKVAAAGVQQIAASAGGAAGEVASLGATLISGGLVAAIPLLIGGAIALGQAFFGASENAKKLREEQDSIAASFKKAADDVADEITKVTILKTVLESEQSTRLQKIDALKELKKINPDYFNQLDIENGKVANLSNVYDAYVGRLLKSINAKANIDLLTKALKEQSEIIGDLNQNGASSFDKFKAGQLSQYQILDAIRKFNLNFGTKPGQKIQLTFDQESLIADLLNSEAKVKSITDNIKGSVQDAFNPKDVKEKPVKEIKIKPEKITVDDKDARFIFPPATFKAIPGGQDTPILAPISKSVQNILNELDRLRNEGQKKLEGFRDMFAGISESIFVSFAEGIGNAGKGGISGFFDGILKSIGNGLKQLGIYFIGASKLIQTIKDKLIAVPQLALIGGIALVALGTAISAAANKKQGFATGTSNSPAGQFLVGERGPELVTLPQGSRVTTNGQLNAMNNDWAGNVTFEIDGMKLRGVLARTDKYSTRNGF